MRENLVALPPSGLIIGLQFWNDGTGGDEAQAMRLARLLADIEPVRCDVTLMFCRRFDTPVSGDFWQTFLHCGQKFPVGQITSRRQATGHPDGSYGLFAGTMDQLSAAWRSGNLNAASVFMVEADGVPLRRDWLDVLIAEHMSDIRAGKRVTGDVVDGGTTLHVNGSLIMHLSTWFDRLSLHETPAGQAWDLFHAAALLQECRSTRLIQNLYGGRCWNPEAIAGVAKYAAWMCNAKDDSAIAWAERTLVDRPAKLGTEEATPGPRRVTVRG